MRRQQTLSAKRWPGHAPELPLAAAVQLSKQINRALHIAKFDKGERALTVAVLLLALSQDPSVSYAGDPDRFIADLNALAATVFASAGKSQLWDTIRLRAAPEHKQAQAAALSTIITLLKDADILSAARAGDLLGTFFESFLKYGNTSKELGIVLTPRQICWLAAEILDVRAEDLIYDPAAGTGGFLIASFNRVCRAASPGQARRFASEHLFGAEDAARVAALAFMNMSLRGGGGHQLKTDSCFNWGLVQAGAQAAFRPAAETNEHEQRAITRVMLNPPFSLHADAQQEIHFVDHALAQLVDQGLLFALLPASIMYEKQFRRWRNLLLLRHTLCAVMSFPSDLFYPVSTETVGLVLRKGRPHQPAQDLLWLRIQDDGFVKKKGYRVERAAESYKAALAEIAEIARAWVAYGTRLPEARGQAEFHPIAADELLPQVHLGAPSIEPAVFEQEVARIYRSLVMQAWDAAQQAGGE